MKPVEEIDLASWTGPFLEPVRRRAIEALESGQVLLFPHLGFPLQGDEPALLSAEVASGARKNITYDPARGTCAGLEAGSPDAARVTSLLKRYSESAVALLTGMAPGYKAGLEIARTTYRPAQIKGRSYDSPKKDDRLLHVDAFPSRPTRGRRILRVFTNINPAGEARSWEVGEPFEAFAQAFLPRLRKPNRAEAWLLARLGITKGERSAYDQIMMQLHDRGKLDAAYQKNAPHHALAFAPQTTWICYTDQVLHAALAGQYALEQTFHVDVAAMSDPAKAPVRVLERLAERTLA